MQVAALEQVLQPYIHATQPESGLNQNLSPQEIGIRTTLSHTPLLLRYYPSGHAHPLISILYSKFKGHWAHLPWYLNWLEGQVNSHLPEVAFLM